MENWVTFLLVNVVLVIVLGVITNLVTPWIKAAYERSIFSSKKKRIQSILSDYQITKIYKDNPFRFIVKLLSDIIVIMFLLFASVVVGSLILINILSNANDTLMHQFYFGFLVLMFIGVFIMINWRLVYTKDKSSDMYDFEEYEQRVIKQLNELGATTDDII